MDEWDTGLYDMSPSSYSDYPDYSVDTTGSDNMDQFDSMIYSNDPNWSDFSQSDFSTNTDANVATEADFAAYNSAEFNDFAFTDSNMYDQQADGSYDVYDQDGNYIGNVDENGNITDEVSHDSAHTGTPSGGASSAGGSQKPNQPPKQSQPPMTKKQILDLIKSTVNQGYAGSNQPMNQYQPIAQQPSAASSFLNVNTLLIAFAAYALARR